MRVQLAPQAPEILGTSDLVIITERVDDVALLIGQMVKMGLPEVLDRHIPRHWTQRRLSWGWTAVIWLAYIVTEGDHRKVSVETYLKGMHHTLSHLTAQVVDPLDFSDDRLSHLLQHLSKPTSWHRIERDLNARSIEVDAWITAGVTKREAGELEQIWRTNDRGHEVLAAEGYELERTCGAAGGEAAWSERVLVVRSPMHATQQAAGLEQRLSHAETQLIALTPPRGRGKRQITDEATLVEAIAHVLTAHRVDGLLSVAWEQQVEQTTQYVGRGRGALSREKRVIEKIRYHITQITRQEDRIAALRQRFGWKAFVTNAEQKRLSLQDAVLCYRHEYRVERIFHRLKSRVHIAPLFVKLNEQIEGLTYLLTLGVRVLTVTEFVLRRSLETEQASLPGLHPENKQKVTDKPTAERILKAFADVSLTIIKNAAGEEILRRLTPLSGVQEDILQRLGLGTALYRQLEIQN